MAWELCLLLSGAEGLWDREAAEVYMAYVPDAHTWSGSIPGQVPVVV